MSPAIQASHQWIQGRLHPRYSHALTLRAPCFGFSHTSPCGRKRTTKAEHNIPGTGDKAGGGRRESAVMEELRLPSSGAAVCVGLGSRSRRHNSPPRRSVIRHALALSRLRLLLAFGNLFWLPLRLALSDDKLPKKKTGFQRVGQLSSCWRYPPIKY
ncbi:unnamed protein product [Arctogadus glacialis]